MKYQISKVKFQIFNRTILSSNQGQVILVLVLISVVGLTIGLSLISRTIIDVRISSQIEQSNRAFSAAEAGVESALRGAVVGGPTGTVSLPGASASYNVTSLGGTTSAYSFALTEIGSSQTLWLIPHNDDGSINEFGTSYPVSSPLDVCWGLHASGTPALIVSLFYREGVNYKVAKGAYDPNIGRGNNFLPVDTLGGYCDGNYPYKKTIIPTVDFGINPSSILLAMRLQPIYSSTLIAVKGDSVNPLPLQGKIVTSIGRSETGIVRKIQVTESYKVPPALLDFALFSEN